MDKKDILEYTLFFTILFSFTLNSNAIENSPIIIKTVAQHYENPTLEQYELCTRSRDNCIKKCGLEDKKCQDKCLICPILIDQDILVQGINDTLYSLPISTTKVNQTNIIRLTNEIRNIIRTSLGNITAHNQNNITIYQKVSKTGGKFGLGYTEKGPCCHLIEPQRCRSSLNGPICTHRRLQTCGSHCISRVMRAKRVVTCNENDVGNCTQSIEYLPIRRRPGCQYTSKWPFITCKSDSSHYRKSGPKLICARCFQIPYLNIIRGQIPRTCQPCFARTNIRKPSFSYPYYNGYLPYQPIASYPSYQPNSFIPPPPPMPLIYENNLYNNEDDSNEISYSLNQESGFKIENQKCINEDGSVIENCTEDESPTHLNIGTDIQENEDDQSFSYDDYELDEDEIVTHRRKRMNRY